MSCSNANHPPSLRQLILLGLFLIVSCVSPACKESAGAEQLPSLGTIQPFDLRSQTGSTFNADSMRGKVWIAAFMFTRCPSICPRITKTMRRLQIEGESIDANFHLVSFSVDPENDTPEVLRRYAKEYGADLSTWTFATGDNSEIKKTAVESFKMALEGSPNAKQDHYGITHGSHFVLVDQSLNIRGFYRSSDDDVVPRLARDAKALAD